MRSNAWRPADLQGFITDVDSHNMRAFLQDATGAISIDLSSIPPAARPATVAAGQQVDVKGGVSVPKGAASPGIVAPSFFNRRAGVRPAARSVSLAAIGSDVCDGRYVDVAGTISTATTWASQLQIELRDGGHVLELCVREFPLITIPALVGARIKARGICTPSPDDEMMKVADFRMLVARFSDLDLTDETRRAIQLPTGLPTLTKIAELRRLAPGEAARHYPVLVRAVVTYFDASWLMLFVQDSTGGVYVDAPAPTTISPRATWWRSPGGRIRATTHPRSSGRPSGGLAAGRFPSRRLSPWSISSLVRKTVSGLRAGASCAPRTAPQTTSSFCTSCPVVRASR